MQPARRGTPVRAVAAVVLLLAGLALLGMWRVVSGNQDLPFDKGAVPPASVAVTKGQEYALAVPGGVPAMIARGVPTRNTGDQTVIALECTWSSPGAAGATRSPLTAAQEESDATKAEDTVGHFFAPITGRITVECAGWGPMFVPNSDDRPHDWAGLALLLSIIALTVGSGLALSELRVALERARTTSRVPVGGDDEIE
jgi:hypothetical protein